MQRPNVFMFSGQGSQYFQMGHALLESNEHFRSELEKLDVFAKQSLGESVIDYLYAPGNCKGMEFTQDGMSSLAIFMVEYALSQALIKDGVCPDYLLTTSVGTFAAASVAGCLPAAAVIEMLAQKDRALAANSPRGKMIAVLGDPQLYEDLPLLRESSVLAGVNFPGSFVVSTIEENVPLVMSCLKAIDVACQVLDVSLPYHSHWIDGAREPFVRHLEGTKLNPPEVPIICCASGGQIEALDGSRLWDVIRKPILFYDTLLQLEEAGPYRYIDVGPAGTLATLAKYGLSPDSESELHSLMSQFGCDVDRYRDLLSKVDNNESG